MRYISTRGIAPELDFDDVLITGLARDGGLYVPKEWPRFSKAEIDSMKSLTYSELAVKIMKPFIGDNIPADDFIALVHETYSRFQHSAIAPLKQLENNLWLLELFHGPTLAFKDYAMQILGGLFDEALRRRGKRTTIVGATSGDTGSAAIEACRNRNSIDIFILFPMRMLAAGCWLLAAGLWLLAAGCLRLGLLVAGCWVGIQVNNVQTVGVPGKILAGEPVSPSR